MMSLAASSARVAQSGPLPLSSRRNCRTAGIGREGTSSTTLHSHSQGAAGSAQST